MKIKNITAFIIAIFIAATIPSVQANGNANFNVCFLGAGYGDTYTVQSSINLGTDWEQTTITATTNNVDSDGHLQVPVAFGTNTSGFFRLISPTNYSPTLGFVKVTIKAGLSKMIANQFFRYSTLIEDMFKNVPSGTMISVFDPDPDFGHVWVTYTNVSGVWNSYGRRLDAGEAALVYNPSSSDITITMSGAVPFQLLDREIPRFSSAIGYKFPKAGTLDSMGFPKVIGDVIWKYRPMYSNAWTWTAYKYGYINNTTNVGWITYSGIPTNCPTMDVGEGFMIQRPVGSSATTWALPALPNIDNGPAMIGVFNSSVTNHLYDYPIPTNCYSLTVGNTGYVMAMAMPGTTCRTSESTNNTNWTAIATNTAPHSTIITTPITIQSGVHYFKWEVIN